MVDLRRWHRALHTHRSSRLLIVGAALLVALVAISDASAQAARGGWQEYAPHDDGALVTYPTGGSDAGVANATSITRYWIETGSGWITARGQHGRYAVGLLRNGWGFDVANTRGNDVWKWGFAGQDSESSVARCVWAQFNFLKRPSNTAFFDCNEVGNLIPPDYMAFFNGNRYGVNCGTRSDGSEFCDGTPVSVDPARCPYGAPAYTNVKPWQPNAAPSTVAYSIPVNATVRWRYVSKDWRYTMMRYEGPKPFAQDWAFIPSYCISNYGYYEWPATA